MTPEEIAVLQAAMGGGSKPTDPYGNEWTGDQRVAALRANGYTWSTLNPPGAGGPGALWVDRYGRTVPESAALQDVLKPPGAPKAQEAPDRITSGGIVYERSADGQWRPAQGIPAASTGDGVGWANLAENKRQFDITQQQRLEDNAARMAEAQKRYEQEQQKINDARAVNAANLLFNQNKEAFAQATQNKQLALQARGQLMQEQQTALDIQLKQSTLDQNWAQFNATMQQRVAEANQQFENQRRDRLANIATQAGTLAQDAGDRGKLAATMLAHSGWGKQNQALAGQNYITDESLTPLESLLRTREQVKSQASPYTFTPIERPARLNMPALPDLNAMMAGMQTPQTVANPQAGSGVFNPQTGQQLNAGQVASDNAATMAAAQSMGLPAAAHGGRMDGAYISGERGPEINIPLGDGQTLVLNQQQAQKMGLDLRKMMENGQPNYQAGGIFSGAFENVGDEDRSLSRDFITQAGQRALAGTPWAGGGQLPSPVYLSSPSIDPITSQLIGSLKALQEGVPAQSTAYYAQMFRPTGMRESVIGRSR